jgi:hypothetical protein
MLKISLRAANIVFSSVAARVCFFAVPHLNIRAITLILIFSLSSDLFVIFSVTKRKIPDQKKGTENCYVVRASEVLQSSRRVSKFRTMYTSLQSKPPASFLTVRTLVLKIVGVER